MPGLPSACAEAAWPDGGRMLHHMLAPDGRSTTRQHARANRHHAWRAPGLEDDDISVTLDRDREGRADGDGGRHDASRRPADASGSRSGGEVQPGRATVGGTLSNALRAAGLEPGEGAAAAGAAAASRGGGRFAPEGGGRGAVVGGRGRGGRSGGGGEMAQPVVCVELQRAMWWATQEELAGSDVGGAGADGFSGGDMAGEPCGSERGADCAICLEAMHEGDAVRLRWVPL